MKSKTKRNFQTKSTIQKSGLKKEEEKSLNIVIKPKDSPEIVIQTKKLKEVNKCQDNSGFINYSLNLNRPHGGYFYDTNHFSKEYEKHYLTYDTCESMSLIGIDNTIQLNYIYLITSLAITK